MINFGLNDYFSGLAPQNTEDACPHSTYAGAMRTGIAALKAQYPDALYIIMGPGRVRCFNDGTDFPGEAGGQLIDYYNLSVALSEELNIPYIDLFNDFPERDIDLSAIWEDGCHYNEYGRYLAGIKIINFLAAQIQ